VAALNAGLAGLASRAQGKEVRFLDFGAGLVGADGSISEDMLVDGVHPGAAGYRLWATAMAPALAELR
jgi:lysophospholipase L1-like esterase